MTPAGRGASQNPLRSLAMVLLRLIGVIVLLPVSAVALLACAVGGLLLGAGLGLSALVRWLLNGGGRP